MEEEKKDPPRAEDERETPPPAQEATFTQAINDIRTEYEKKFAELNEKHKRELDERNNVIKQLLTGDKSEAQIPDEAATVADIINKKRNYEI